MKDKTRINRVITRSGDQGETGLADGSRLAKDAPVIEALGELDELNACIGVLRGRQPSAEPALLESIQQRLFDIGAELAMPGTEKLMDDDVEALEQAAARLLQALPPLREFVLPGGNDAGAWCHYCRTVARRAERRLVSTRHVGTVNPASLRYLNRLSDLLFVLARHLNRTADTAETLWQPRGKS